jgi:hypothetical protein
MASGQLTALEKKVVPQLFFMRIDLLDNPIYVHNGATKITFDSKTWIGIYDFAMMDVIEEQLENRPSDIRVGIRKIPKLLIDPVIIKKNHGRPAFLYHSVADFLGQPVDTPTEVWRGTVDYPNLIIEDDGVQYFIVLKNVANNWNRAKTRRITDAEQQRRFPGDTAYKRLPGLEDKKILWGPDPNKETAVPPPRDNTPRYRNRVN